MVVCSASVLIKLHFSSVFSPNSHFKVCRGRESLSRLDSLLDLDEGGADKVEEARKRAHAKASKAVGFSLW